MHSYRINSKRDTRYGLFIFAAVLFVIIMQPCFETSVYSDIVEKDSAPDKDINKISIVAELNGEPISTQDLLKRYNIFSFMSGASLKLKDRISVDFYLESYFTEQLLIQEAERMKINISRDEIEQEKKKYLTKNDVSEEEFEKSLPSFRLTMEDIDNYLEKNLMILRLGAKKFADIAVSDEEARKYYDRNYDYFHSPEKVSLSHILICHKNSTGCRSDLDEKQAKEFAENIRKLATPKNFANLAKQFSTDKTGADGGDLGYIARGSAVPPIEKVAFSLKKGEISDVVESEFGYHIILLTGKRKALSMTFNEARDLIIKNLKEQHIASELMHYSVQLLKTADIKKYTSGLGKITDVEGKSSIPSKEFRTFKNTGKAINFNSKGQPVILFFGSAGCSHCRWISETYDTVVMEYMEQGLIEAHHYDITTQDDLLTPIVETEIPKDYLNIKEGNAPEFIPYFNFGGTYERTGTGYESQDDFFAEEMEMRQVIDALLSR